MRAFPRRACASARGPGCSGRWTWYQDNTQASRSGCPKKSKRAADYFKRASGEGKRPPTKADQNMRFVHAIFFIGIGVALAYYLLRAIRTGRLLVGLRGGSYSWLVRREDAVSFGWQSFSASSQLPA
jgi:hypothetical protein